MNTRTPLAAALLMTASSVMAQFNPPAPTNPALPTNVFSLGSASALPPMADGVFSCSDAKLPHIPYKACETDDLNKRELVIKSGKCPQPATDACKDFFGRLSGPNPVATIAAKTPPPGTEWADPVNCAQIPCLTKAMADAAIKEAQKSNKLSASDIGAPPAPTGAPDFIGPPLPPGFYDKQDKEALSKARQEIGQNGVKDVVDLGGGRLAMMMKDGTVGMCTRSQCEKPVPAASVKDPKIAAWVADNKMTNGSGGGGMTASNTPAPVNLTNAGNSGGGLPGAGDNPQSTPSDEAKNLGREASHTADAITGKSGSSAGGSGTGGAGSFASNDAASGATDKKPIAVSPEEVKKQAAKSGYSFIKVGEAAQKGNDILLGGAKALDNSGDPKKDGNVTLKYRGIQTEAQ